MNQTQTGLSSSDAQRRRADRVAGLPQPVSRTGDSPGQHRELQEGKESLWPTCDRVSSHESTSSLLTSDDLFNAVPAGCRDVVRLLGETQLHSGPEGSVQQDQPRGRAGTGGTTLLENLVWKLLANVTTCRPLTQS